MQNTLKGQFRIVKRNTQTDEIVYDSGFQDNIILDQCLEFLGGANTAATGTDMMQYCLVGTGNSTPAVSQVKLDNAVAGLDYSKGNNYSTRIDYDSTRDGNFYKINRVCKYSFSGLDNQNISEVGLASFATLKSGQVDLTYPYNLCTRALIKDTTGNPTTITILPAEVLEIYYKIWMVMDLSDITGTFNLLDGVGGSVPYNFTAKPCGVGGVNIGGSGSYRDGIGRSCDWNTGNNSTYVTDGVIGVATSQPTIYYAGGNPNGTGVLAQLGYGLGASWDNYVPGSNKRSGSYNIGIDKVGNAALALFMTTMGFWQVQFSKVSDNTPIVKNNLQTLSIPFEVSWSRYTGTLS